MSNHIPELPYKDFSRRVFSRSVQDPQPTRVQFELTYRCNIHCVHCYTDPFNTPTHLRRELSVEEMLRIFDELANAGALWMTMTGGEAFVHPQFRQIYREAKRRGFIISLYSNGTTITESLADFLAADPPFTIDVSCHGATAETFETVTQVPGSFRPFQEGIRRLLDRRLPLTIKTKAMTVLTPFLHSLLDRGLDISQGILVLLDGGKGLRAAVRNKALRSKFLSVSSQPGRTSLLLKA